MIIFQEWTRKYLALESCLETLIFISDFIPVTTKTIVKILEFYPILSLIATQRIIQRWKAEKWETILVCNF